MNNVHRISKQEIIFNINNLPQLVFEVTDACNFRCKYCGYADIYEGYDKREADRDYVLDGITLTIPAGR